MSFDPITAIWAANRTAEMAGGSGGGLPKVELTTKANVMSSDPVALLPEDTIALNDAWNLNSPCIVSVGINGTSDVINGVFIRHEGVGVRRFESLYFHPWVGLAFIEIIGDSDTSEWEIGVDVIVPAS